VCPATSEPTGGSIATAADTIHVLAWYEGKNMNKVMHAFCECNRALTSAGRVPGKAFGHPEAAP
jgi:hypothetical protein